MFSKTQSTYILKINNFKSIDLILDDKIIKNEELNESIVFNEKIRDPDQLGYIINKILADVNLEDNILIRYASPNNIFRFKEVEGLENNDLEGYVKYNIEDFLPYSLDNIEVKPQLLNNQILLFGIKKNIVNFIENLLSKLGYKKLYFTIFQSEAISFLFNQREEDSIFLDIENDHIEYLIWKNNRVKRFKSFKVLDERLREPEVLEIKVKKLIDKTIKDINELIDINNYTLFITGDVNKVNIWSYNLEKIYGYKNQIHNFDVNSYFGD